MTTLEKLISNTLVQRYLDQDAEQLSSIEVPNRTPHAWGWSAPLFITDRIEVVLFCGKEGGVSSWHKHESKNNEFLSFSGRIYVEWRRADGRIVRDFVYGHQTRHVPIKSKHRLLFGTDAVGIEIYSCPPGNSPIRPGEKDIMRFDEGTSGE